MKNDESCVYVAYLRVYTKVWLTWNSLLSSKVIYDSRNGLPLFGTWVSTSTVDISQKDISHR